MFLYIYSSESLLIQFPCVLARAETDIIQIIMATKKEKKEREKF